MDYLSAYILTKNSEKYLREILEKLGEIADEIVVLDSGSTDETFAIVSDFPSCSWHFRTFDNFRDQRNYAINLCRYDHVFFVDSDEIPDQDLLDSIKATKGSGFKHDAYEVNREWVVMGQRVHCVYPVKTPDSPIRLMNRKYVSFEASSLVHEAPSGHRSLGKFSGRIWHYTFHDRDELYAKLDFYTDIAARDILARKARVTWADVLFRPLVVFVKWYLFNGGYKDGKVGLLLARFAFENVALKYQKARTVQ